MLLLEAANGRGGFRYALVHGDALTTEEARAQKEKRLVVHTVPARLCDAGLDEIVAALIHKSQSARVAPDGQRAESADRETAGAAASAAACVGSAESGPPEPGAAVRCRAAPLTSPEVAGATISDADLMTVLERMRAWPGIEGTIGASWLEASIERLGALIARVDELLAANNEEVERRRAAQADLARTKLVVDRLAASFANTL